ncbi:hypothetical protein VroAM7_11440 [Vibrio rotiferianus]|uniref:Uncharacterized protein n=1 Tax=Vibrio rotiferianus TaxID=190895 RepID=A0A510I4V3_9VIBR|nr:hypothetical protein [Vibrio rotiferianus]BBL88491.1 hypothetical protein VroAM7_11440 [Vibrio rotiferianus]
MKRTIIALTLGLLTLPSHAKPIQFFTGVENGKCVVAEVGKTSHKYESKLNTSPIDGSKYCETLIPKEKFSKSICFLSTIEVRGPGKCGFRDYGNRVGFRFDGVPLFPPVDCEFTCID